MCGIAGFLGGASFAGDYPPLLASMSEAIIHRGPDVGGQWHDADSRVGLTMRRLAIQDLSPAGHQPMFSASGRYVLVFNGEAYNHLEVREELVSAGGQPNWRGHSDTETILAAVEHWGLDSALKRFRGMFALALWDRRDRRLSLARDRLGEKPLYYGWVGSGSTRAFVFGSELKSLKRHPDFDQAVDRGALSLFLRHNCVPAPYTIYEGIKKLMPGQIVWLDASEIEPRLSTFWSGAEVIAHKLSTPFAGSAEEAVNQLDGLLSDAVRGQMLSDVPLGALLSGGIDSSLVVALMQQHSRGPVKTFTIGFGNREFNEAAHAKEVAAHLGTDHSELYVSPRMALDVIPRLPALYDEPFSDSSQIPTFLVSQLARQRVTVALTGDGGDELFGGYNRYSFGKLWPLLERLPLVLRRAVADATLALSPGAWDDLARPIGRLLPAARNKARVGDNLHKTASVLRSRSLDAVYRSLVSHWSDEASVVLGAHAPPTIVTDPPKALDDMHGIERMMALDMLTYLPDDILTKVDRAAMGVSLETRVPMLDHHVVEFAWSLPLDVKIRDGQTKWPLRQILRRHVPTGLFDRPKAGFAVPLADWLRVELRDWAETLLAEGRLRDEGLFDPQPIRRKWAEHVSGTRNWSYDLWDVLMFQSWLTDNHGR